jgi:hypothetical protein
MKHVWSSVGICGVALGMVLGLGFTADIRAAEFDLVEAHTTPPDHPYTLGMVASPSRSITRERWATSDRWSRGCNSGRSSSPSPPQDHSVGLSPR